MKSQNTNDSKDLNTHLMDEDSKSHSPEETFISHSSVHHKKKKNSCKECFMKFFCCFFGENAENGNSKEILENPSGLKVKLHNKLVKSSVDLKEDLKVDKSYSEESNQDPEVCNIVRIIEEKTLSETNLKVCQLIKKNSKKNERRKLSSDEHIKDFPINKLSFLFSPDKTHFLLVKITQKYLTITEKEKSGSSNPLPSSLSTSKPDSINGKNKEKIQTSIKYSDNPYNIFTLYEKGIKLDTENWEKVCPEKLSKYIAKRAKSAHFNLVLDCFCGIGGNTIQLAKECACVIGVDNCEKQVNYLKHNATIYGINDKIDYIVADFLKFQFRQVDVVFLNPSSDFKKNDNEKFSLFKHIQPDIIEILKKTFEISSNFLLLLPKFLDFSELPIIFNMAMCMDMELEKESIEIELININNSMEYVLIHFGKTSFISQNEELEFLNTYVNNDNNSNIHNNIKFLRYMIKKLGIRKIMTLILSAESQQQTAQNETLFQRFLDELRSYDYLTIEEQQEYLMDYIKHGSLLTPGENKGKYTSKKNNDQSPALFESKMKKLDSENNFSFTEQKKIHQNSQTNLNSFSNSPNFEVLKKNHLHLKNEENSNSNILTSKTEKFMIIPADAMLNKNPKASNLTHKSDDILPSFYSGRLIEPSPKENFIENHMENLNLTGDDDHKYSSLKLQKILKSWSGGFQKSEKFDDFDDSINDERRESRSFQ